MIETACLLNGRPSDGTVSFGAISRCLHDLGRPDRKYRSVHVTGTNGKTTVCRMIAALLQRSVMTVGLYSSPYLARIVSAFSSNGRPISEQEFIDTCNHVKPFMNWEGLNSARSSFSPLRRSLPFVWPRWTMPSSKSVLAAGRTRPM